MIYMTPEDKLASMKIAFALYSASPSDPRDIAHGFLRTCADIFRGVPLKEIGMPEIPSEVRAAYEPRANRSARTAQGRQDLRDVLRSQIPDDPDAIPAWWAAIVSSCAQLPPDLQSFYDDISTAMCNVADSIMFVDAHDVGAKTVKSMTRLSHEWDKVVGEHRSCDPWRSMVVTLASEYPTNKHPRPDNVVDAREAAYASIRDAYPELVSSESILLWTIQQIDLCASLRGASTKEQTEYVERLHRTHVNIMGAITCYRALPRTSDMFSEEDKLIGLALAAYAALWLGELEKMESALMWPSRDWFTSARLWVNRIKRLAVRRGIISPNEVSEETEDQDAC